MAMPAILVATSISAVSAPHGLARRGRVERERPQRLSLMRQDRRRPAGTKAVLLGERAVVGPARIGRDIGDHDRLAQPRRRAARAGHRADGEAVDRPNKARGKARGGAVAQARAVLVEQKDGAFDAWELRFDQPRQAIEDVAERRVGRNHLEDPRLAVAQAVGKLARRYVARNADEADDLAALAAKRNLGRGNPAHSAVGADDILLAVDQRLARLDDASLVGEILLSGLRRMQLEIGLADQFARAWRSPICRAVASFAIKKRLPASLSQRLSGTRSISF